MMKLCNRGFTLSELMIASAILLVGILGLFTTIIHCMVLNESNNNLVKAVNCAQYSLERLKGETFSNVTGAYVLPVCVVNNQNVQPILAVTGINPGLKEVRVDVNWTERERNRNFNLSTRLAR